MQKRIVTINGRDYDTRTGLPVVQKVAAPSKHATAHSTVLHQSTQRSQTLNRRFVHNPYASPSQAAPTPQAVAAPQTTPAITKFYREPAKPVSAPRPKTTAVFSDIRPSIPHPTVERAIAKQQHKQAPQAMHTMPKPSDVLKREAIETSLKAAPSHTSREQVKRHKSPKKSKWSFARLATAGATLVLVGAYFTYLNMPSLSVRIAAAQAGIDASYPSYQPTGYSLSGPIAYDNGQVRMRFAMNGSDRSFNLDQTKSGWDSSAVYENFVKPKVGDDYTTTRSNGITIYTYDNNAAWVNNGILYTVSGDAPLSPEQIQRIASSM